MELGSFFISIYVTLWLVTFIVYYNKRHFIDTGGFIIITFVIYSIASLILSFDHENRGSVFAKHEITFFPLLYLYCMIMISMLPVFRYNQRKIKRLITEGQFTIDAITWIYILAALIQIPMDLIHAKEGLTTILLSSSGGLDIYHDVMEESKIESSGITSIPSIIVNALSEIQILIAFYNIAKRQRQKTTIILFIIFALLPFTHIARAQRGPAVSIVLTIIATYFLFNKFYPDSFKKNIKRIAFLLVILLGIPFIALTHSRFDRSDGGVESSIISYLGQENLNFDIYAFDNNGLRNGDRVVPLFKQMLGYEKVPHNFWERRQKYPKLKINDEVFIGYVGDFVLDFGPIASALIFIIFTSFFLTKTKIKNNQFYFKQLLIIQFLSVLSVQGGMKLYPFADNASLKIIAFILIYIFISLEKSYITHSKIYIGNEGISKI